MKAIVNLVKAAVKKVRKAFTKEEIQEVETSVVEMKENPVKVDKIEKEKLHKSLMESGYTLGQAKKFGKLVHIYKNTKAFRVKKKNINRLFDLQSEVYKK